MPQPSYTQSRKWINPTVKHRDQARRLNNAQRKLCKDSPFFHIDFDIEQHRRDMAADRQQYILHCTQRRVEEISHRSHTSPRRSFTTIKPPFLGRPFKDNRASVLTWETIFTPAYELNRVVPYGSLTGVPKPLSPWPCKAEARYEGDERISTDRLHGRFPGVPRVPGNDTVNWMQKSIVEQYLFDNFWPPPHPRPGPREVEVWMRDSVVEELEVDWVKEDGVSVVLKSVVDEIERWWFF